MALILRALFFCLQLYCNLNNLIKIQDIDKNKYKLKNPAINHWRNKFSAGHVICRGSICRQ